MNDRIVRVALVREVFYGEGGAERLEERLAEAKAHKVDLVVLPELPLNTWCPATRDAKDEDAEEPGGERHALLAELARRTGTAVLGGAIVRSEGGRRTNTALVFDSAGELLGSYAKLHLPEEEGFWETSHYEPGTEPPTPIHGLGFELGVQICSDAQRPQAFHLLAAQGCDLVAVPRASEAANWEPWKYVLRAHARTSTCFVASVGRPGPEAGVAMGGPSIVIGPDGDVQLETEEPFAVAELAAEDLEGARKRYPGYVAVRSDVYARGWSRLAENA